MQVNERRVEALVGAINASPQFTFEKFLHQVGVTNYEKTHSGNIKVSCLFHKDKTPSLNLNEETGKWNCFSCNNGGRSLINLMYKYHTEVEGIDQGYYSFLNTFLAKNESLSNSLGFKSLFELEYKKFVPEEFKLIKLDLKRAHTQGPLSLPRIMKKEGLDDIYGIKAAIVMVQADFPIGHIISTLKKGVRSFSGDREVSISLEDYL